MSDLVSRGRHPSDPTGERYGDTHWPLPSHYSGAPPLHVAIDREKMVFIGAGEYRVLWAEARKTLLPDKIIIGEAEAGSTYSKLTELELKTLYKNTAGTFIEGANYASLLQECKGLGLQIPALPIPEGLVRAPGGKSQEIKSTNKTEEAAKSPRGALTRPNPSTATGQVWTIADELSASLKGSALREEVVKRGKEAGINPATIQVQYSKWKKEQEKLP
jgi:hypothetical protein